MNKRIPRIMIAAAGSGGGKTTVVCGLLACLKNRGLTAAAFKCGPDYIDPMFHEQVLGVQSCNLDGFFMDEAMLNETLLRYGQSADISIIEGVMGYYDGIGMTKAASNEAVAEVTETPVVLILNCKGMSRSIRALLKGFIDSQEKPMIHGVIFNRLPASLYPELKHMAEQLGVQALGYIPDSSVFGLKSRHLGLVLPGEINDFQAQVEEIAALLEKTVDVEAVTVLAAQAAPIAAEPACGAAAGDEVRTASEAAFERAPVIAVARDAAFNFIYRDNLELLRRLGCQIRYFSPLADEKLPGGIGALLLSGGYPELYADVLSKNHGMINSIKAAIHEGIPYIAECGGFMYLHEYIETPAGERYNMVGTVSGGCKKGSSMGHFGYACAEALKDNMLCKKGGILKCHEFHYYQSTSEGSDLHLRKPSGNREWMTAFVGKNYYMGYPHFYYGAICEAVKRFTACARAYQFGDL